MDRDIDAIELGLLVRAGVDRLLIDDGVDGDGGLAGLTVADDQFALAAADRDHAVDGFQSGGHGLMDRFAGDDAGGFDLDFAEQGGVDRSLAVDRLADGVDDPPNQGFADRDFGDPAGALDGVAFLD